MLGSLRIVINNNIPKLLNLVPDQIFVKKTQEHIDIVCQKRLKDISYKMV